MTRPFDQAFAKAYAQRPRDAKQRSAPIEQQAVAASDGRHQVVIQIPAHDVPAVPAPHIDVSTVDQPVASHADSASADTNSLLQSHTTLITPQAATTDWIVATIGVDMPSAGAIDTDAAEQSPILAPPTKAETAAPTEHNKADEAAEVVEVIKPMKTPADDSLSEPRENAEKLAAVNDSPDETKPLDPALSALDIPLLLEQQMLESLHRAADSMRTADDQLQKTTKSVQAFLPVWEVDRLHWPEHVLELESELAEELQGAADGIRAAAAEGMQVLGFTSLRPSAGRTTTMLLLARAINRVGQRVLIVDAANELQTVAEQCGIDSPYGWNEAIVEGKPVEEAATHSVADGVTLLAWSPGETESLARLEADKVRTQWQRLRQAVDVILVELPTMPSAALTTLAHHSGLCDALLLVKGGDDSDTEIGEAVKLLQQNSTHAVGVVDNAFRAGEN